MFHYKHLVAMNKWGRASKDIEVGDWVQSRYRSPWYGIVLALNAIGGIAKVKQILNKRGGPIHNPKTVEYHCDWFRKVKPQL